MFTVYAEIIIHELETGGGLVIKVICFIDHRWWCCQDIVIANNYEIQQIDESCAE